VIAKNVTKTVDQSPTSVSFPTQGQHATRSMCKCTPQQELLEACEVERRYTDSQHQFYGTRAMTK